MLTTTNFRICVVALALLTAMTGRNAGQVLSSNVRGCALIDKAHSAQFISYEAKSESKILLRLRNNTDCSIVVETDDVDPTQRKRLPNGGLKIEPVASSQDGVMLRLHYLVQDRKRGEAPKPGYGWGDSVFTYEISTGQSVIFAVPVSHFKSQLDIAVPFNFSWEDKASVGMGVGGVVHRVYFLHDDLPSEALLAFQK